MILICSVVEEEVGVGVSSHRGFPEDGSQDLYKKGNDIEFSGGGITQIKYACHVIK